MPKRRSRLENTYAKSFNASLIVYLSCGVAFIKFATNVSGKLWSEKMRR